MAHRSHRPGTLVSAETIAAGAAEFRSPVFMEALVAAVALVTHADGESAPAERSRLASLISENQALSGFTRHQIVDELAIHEANFRLDPEVAMELAREKLTPIVDNPRLGSAVVRVCRAIIPADGVIHPAEHRALAEIRTLLGLTARPVVFGSFGLLGSGPTTAARGTTA